MTFKDLAELEQSARKYPIIIAKVGSQIHELADECSEENVEFLDICSDEGMEVYRKSLTFLMLKALDGIAKVDNADVMFSFGNSLYIEANGDFVLDDEFLLKLKNKMHRLVDKDIPFEKLTVKTSQAIQLFHQLHMDKKAQLFKFRRTSSTNLYNLDGFYNYLYSDLAYSTGILSVFDLKKYGDGFLLLFPNKENPTRVAAIPHMPKLFQTLKENSEWTNMMNVHSIGELNEAIVQGKMDDIILIQESLMEHKIANIAKEIVEQDKRFVFIAGPSSSGKTSFSNRLSVQLRTYGYQAHPIACDDYFKNRRDIPFNEKGIQDFEAFSVLDLDLLEKDVAALQRGDEIQLPHFNFAAGEREYLGKTLKLGNKDIIVMEGIHCLNPKFLPNSNSYRIYISALTTLNMDNHNRISSSDLRLIRRMARDSRHRNINPTETIRRWQSVREGEEKNIFPYQENADVIFNSSFVYEIPMMKAAAERLLFSVKRDSEEWITAKKLLKFLDFTLSYSDNSVPNNSLLREFLGGSCFNVG